MGRYNTFRGKIVCPHCGKSVKTDFQSKAGRLEWHDFEIGDNIWNAVIESDNSPVIPDTDVDLDKINFRTNGIGKCPECGKDVIAGIIIEKGVYTGLEIQKEPLKETVYEFLEKWEIY